MPLLPTVDLAQRDTVRLISTGRLKEPVLLPLAANHEALENLAGLESVTNGRLKAQEAGLPELDPRELVFGRAGYTLINAAFTHTRPGGNRFNGEDRGAWYCAFEVETSIDEVSYHLTRELEAIARDKGLAIGVCEPASGFRHRLSPARSKREGLRLCR